MDLPMSEYLASKPIVLTPENVDARLSDLPRVVRLAFGFGSKLRRGTLDVTLPDGRQVRLGGVEDGPSASMTIYGYGFASRLLNGGDIGIAEAYLHGEWDTPDLTQFLYLFCVNHDLIQAMLGDNPMMRFVQLVRHWFNRNTRRQARKNIYAHYDIGNAFYSAWLDPSMTYSSAIYEDGTQDLTAAQNNKYKRLAEAIDLQPGQRVLEIGCGWGGFAEYAAKYHGAHVTGLTISREQRDFAHAGGRALRPGRDQVPGLSRRARPV
jgi:cyclopropane-fatty-acyl-phospholipid synthase